MRVILLFVFLSKSVIANGFVSWLEAWNKDMFRTERDYEGISEGAQTDCKKHNNSDIGLHVERHFHINSTPASMEKPYAGMVQIESNLPATLQFLQWCFCL